MNRRLLWLTAASLCLALAAVAFVVRQFAESNCVATDAAGQRVVIGTELTPAGQRYKQENPADDNHMILESLVRRGVELAWTRESIARCRLMLSVPSIVLGPLSGLAVLFGLIAARARPGAGATRRVKPAAFLSYNHADSAPAQRLLRLMEQNNIDVIVDTRSMTPGERIEAFIERSIRDCDVVVSLVSGRSLLSAWVALETIQSLQGKHLIGCYLDDAFLDDEFRLQATRRIDERLGRIEELLPEYARERLDTVDLNEEKTRLYQLRNNLGLILATLKDSLCLDLREATFEESGKRLVAAIRASKRTAGAPLQS